MPECTGLQTLTVSALHSMAAFPLSGKTGRGQYLEGKTPGKDSNRSLREERKATGPAVILIVT